MFRILSAPAAALAAGTLILAGYAAGQTSMGTKSPDSKFVMEAAQGGIAEVKLGQLAAEKASSADVKKFGQQMVDDHSKANDELKSVASQKGITLPSNIGSKHQALYDRLSKLSGDAFDKAYVTAMLSDHKKDVGEFQKEANSGKDPDVKAFASKTLPTLQEHLRMVQEVHGKVSGATSADRMKQ